MKNSGQALVELGVAFLVLMFLISGAAEFGILFFQYIQLRDAAQEGALYASANLPLDTLELEQRVRYASDSPMNLNDVNVQVYVNINGGTKTLARACEGDGLEVVVEYPHKVMMPFMPKILGSDVILLRGKVTNTVLRPICQ